MGGEFCNTANNNTCEVCPGGTHQRAVNGHNELTCLTLKCNGFTKEGEPIGGCGKY